MERILLRSEDEKSLRWEKRRDGSGEPAERSSSSYQASSRKRRKWRTYAKDTTECTAYRGHCLKDILKRYCAGAAALSATSVQS